MTEFQKMVQDIVKYYKRELDRSTLAYSRMNRIDEMQKELKAMKETWEMLHPNDDTSVPSFKQLMETV